MDGERKRESLRDVLCIEEEEEERGEEMSLCFFSLPGAARRSFKPFRDTVMEIYIGLSAQSDLTCFVMIHFFSLKPKVSTSSFSEKHLLLILLIFAVDVGGITLQWTFVTSETLIFLS